jgi:hypothetical protein
MLPEYRALVLAIGLTLPGRTSAQARQPYRIETTYVLTFRGLPRRLTPVIHIRKTELSD